jgi:hypothetical protein
MAIKSLLIGGGVITSVSALAAPPPGSDGTLAPWFHSLQVPSTHEGCCGVSDYRNYPVRVDVKHYQVFYDNRWLAVPTAAISERVDNPTGNYVT